MKSIGVSSNALILQETAKRNIMQHPAKGAYIKYVGGWEGATGGFYKFFKKIRSPGDYRPKYFMAQ